jgi:uncharacterized membrane protein YgcG
MRCESDGCDPLCQDKGYRHNMILSIRSTAAALSLLAVCSLSAQPPAQIDNNEKKEFALSIGALSGTSPSPAGGPLAVGSGFTVQANFAGKIRDLKWANLYWEVDGLAAPIRHLAGTPVTATSAIHSYYLTPGLRLQFVPKERFSPWVAAGGGYGFYDSSGTSISGGKTGGGTSSTGGSSSTGVAEFGAGIDYVLNKRYVLRGDMRGFYTANPNFGVPTPGTQLNFMVSGGIVWRFPR